VRDVELFVDVGTEAPGGSCAKPESRPDHPAQLTEGTPVYIFVSVKDTGPGLTPSELDMVFQRFSQASPQTHTVFGGSGLGLFVCRKITEVMGGGIEVVSEAGKGSTFRFFVKARPVLYSASGEDSPSLKALSTCEERAPGAKASANLIKQAAAQPRRRVLIVEDNLINQKVLTRQLKHIGLDVDVANDGVEGVKKIHQVMRTIPPEEIGDEATPRERPFDCVLMDLEMPVMDGYTATRSVRASERAGAIQRTVIIALSKLTCVT
jgi:CheY-like chemotaxis protein